MRLTREAVAHAGLLLGPVLALAAFLLLPDRTAAGDGGLSPAGRATAAVAVWMATWWLTEAVPIAATALLPIVLFPLFGAAGVKDAAAPYANPLIFLFMGGFIIGLAIQRFDLHRRIALQVLRRVGTSPRRLVGGFMLASALLSMWISNTATAIMMLPIGASVLAMLREHAARRPGGKARPDPAGKALGIALMLGIAYGCSIGGVGTLVGTPPNLILAAFLEEQFDIQVTMLDWLAVGLPLMMIMLPATWWYLTRIAFDVPAQPLPGGREVIDGALRGMGAMTRAERMVLGVFLLTAAAWILRPQLVAWTGLTALDDTVIALLGGLVLFVLPVGRDAKGATRFAMDWDTAKQVPWEILILFGGGLSLADAISRNGVDTFIGSAFGGLAGAPLWLILLAVVAMVIFLTEITSNTAVTTTLMPVLAATALALDVPAGMLLIAAAVSASYAFMLPVATPPNAIVFSSGYVTIADMARAGLWLNLAGIAVVTVVTYFAAAYVLGSA